MPSWREDERLHDLNDLLFFAAVVEHSGFSAAARSLNLPKSSVSRHVGRLEDRLGVRLLERSTRNVRLTEIGSSYYARCKAILSELETAEQDLALLRSDRHNPGQLPHRPCPIRACADRARLPGRLSFGPGADHRHQSRGRSHRRKSGCRYSRSHTAT